MAKMPKIELQDIQALGSKEVILLEQKEVTIYEDKKPTDKKQKVCVVVCPSNEFNKVNVNVITSYSIHYTKLYEGVY